MSRGRTARAVLAAGALAGALLGMTSEAGAQDRFNTRVGRVTNGPFYRVTAALRLNPLGLFGEGRFGFRTRLFDTPGASILLKNTYLAGGISFTTSPAFVRPGIFVEFAPLAILNFQANLEHVWWYGNFQYMQSFPHVIGPRQATDMGAPSQTEGSQSFSDAQINRNRDAGLNYAGRGFHLTLGATLQAKVGDLAIRSNFRGVRYWMNTSGAGEGRGGDRTQYDIFYDVLAPTNGWLFLNDTDIIYQATDLGFNVGLRLSTAMPLYQAADFAPGQAQEHNNTTMRLGPLVSYTFREQRHRAFNAPTVFMLAQWWLMHPYRTGVETSQGFPMVVLGFAFRGDN